jgi:hypothetical protein
LSWQYLRNLSLLGLFFPKLWVLENSQKNLSDLRQFTETSYSF